MNPHGGGVSFGSDLPAEIVSESGGLGADGDNGQNGSEARDMIPVVKDSSVDAELLGANAEERVKKTKSRGGFRIEFRNHGPENFRARYAQDERTIYVNLDHDQLSNALAKRSIDDIVFKRVAYEVAFAEYAIALASELAQHNAYLDFFEPISDIRETINRIATRAAHLYAE